MRSLPVRRAVHEATFHLLEGDADACEAIFGQIRHGYRLGIPTIAAWIDAKETWLYLHRGDLDEARRLLTGPSATSEAASCGLIGADWSIARGWLAWEEDRFAEACAYLGSAGGENIVSTFNSISAGPAFLALRVDSLMRLGRADEAAAAISATEAFSLEHARFIAAGLAAARFRYEPTPPHAIIAEQVAATAPWPWLQALNACWRGEFLRDAAAAASARAQFTAIGANLGVRRAEAVMRALNAKVPGPDRGAEVLSPREIEVAELIAAGLSNPAIAHRLYLSRATVASHVKHILAKLGFSSRSQIAAWTAQRKGNQN
jgi:DNA-binding CsgD family transcriptional regulator